MYVAGVGGIGALVGTGLAIYSFKKPKEEKNGGGLAGIPSHFDQPATTAAPDAAVQTEQPPLTPSEAEDFFS